MDLSEFNSRRTEGWDGDGKGALENEHVRKKDQHL